MCEALVWEPSRGEMEHRHPGPLTLRPRRRHSVLVTELLEPGTSSTLHVTRDTLHVTRRHEVAAPGVLRRGVSDPALPRHLRLPRPLRVPGHQHRLQHTGLRGTATAITRYC